MAGWMGVPMKRRFLAAALVLVLGGCAPRLKQLDAESSDALAEQGEVKDPGLAASLSLISPGLGLVYAGQLTEGMAVADRLNTVLLAGQVGLGIGILGLLYMPDVSGKLYAPVLGLGAYLGATDDRGTRTSHFLIYVGKHPLGYTIMKDIMAKESSSRQQGVASFEYSPADARYPLLFSLSRPLEDLEAMILTDFAGKTVTVRGLFEAHHIDRPYTLRNYKDVLLKLEKEGKIVMDPSDRKPRLGEKTLADHVKVMFSGRA